jgi:hypothetical protein
MKVLKKGLIDEESVELLNWNIIDDDQDGSDIDELDDLSKCFILYYIDLIKL